MQRLIFTLALICWVIASTAHSQTSPPEVLKSAQEGLQAFLSRVPLEARGHYGFTRSDDFQQARLGTAFNLYTITPQSLLTSGADTPVTSLLSKTAMWYFPVMIHNEIRALLVVDQVDGQWQAVSLGYAELAKALDRVGQRWPQAEGFHPQLIAVFQAKEYLVRVPEYSSNDLISIFPTGRELMGGNAAGVIERLKPVVKEAIQQR
jgi:hypothetical protein